MKSLAVAFLIGPVYALLAFGGFLFSPAFHGGIFMNGFLPLITVFLSFILGKKIKLWSLIGVTIILFGSIIILFEAQGFHENNIWFGDMLFFLAAISLSFFMILVKKWDLQYGQILYSICIVNAVLYLPVWFFFLPSGVESISVLLNDRIIIMNVLFQGFVPNLISTEQDTTTDLLEENDIN